MRGWNGEGEGTEERWRKKRQGGGKDERSRGGTKGEGRRRGGEDEGN